MSIFSKAKKLVRKVEQDVGLKSKPKKPAPYVDPDPINPLTGRPMSQNAPQDPFAGQSTGIGQMPSYQPPPVAENQRIPQGLGSNVFRSTIAPLQQQGYGLAQIDPRFLTSTVRLPGGSTMPQPAPTQAPAPVAPPSQLDQLRQLGLIGGLGQIRKFQ